MGGLVAREALNLRGQGRSESPPIEFISLATPFGGHPSARLTVGSSGMVLPSWRDINPDSVFIRRLYRTRLADDVNHHLFFGFNNSYMIKLGDNSDGVVPLSSQLDDRAQHQSVKQRGLGASHTTILTDPKAIEAVIKTLSKVKLGGPECHIFYYLQGGYEVQVGSIYNETEQYYLRHYGRFLQALSEGHVRPDNAWQEELLLMLRGTAEPKFDAARAWRKFIENSEVGSFTEEGSPKCQKSGFSHQPLNSEDKGRSRQ
jgi:hypothetical protein